jgi:hypothetical protein
VYVATAAGLRRREPCSRSNRGRSFRWQYEHAERGVPLDVDKSERPGWRSSGKVQRYNGAHRRAVRGDRHRRLHVHTEAPPPRGRQDPRAEHGPVLARHAAAAGRQGAVRRPALRRDGGVGARGVRRRAHPARSCSRSSPTTSWAASRSTRRSSRARTSPSRASPSPSRCSSRRCSRCASTWRCASRGAIEMRDRTTTCCARRRSSASTWSATTRARRSEEVEAEAGRPAAEPPPSRTRNIRATD